MDSRKDALLVLSLGGQGETVELWLAQGEETLVSCQGRGMAGSGLRPRQPPGGPERG